MKKTKKFPYLQVKLINYQRNGISGKGFYVIKFNWNEPGSNDFGITNKCKHMVATVFEEEGACGVICLDDLKQCWRGDYFEAALRDAIKTHEDVTYKILGR